MDLPLIWSGLIATAVMLYVLLDGADLGIGILTAFAKDKQERNLMTATIEPVWDGNETWLILGGGGLFEQRNTVLPLLRRCPCPHRCTCCNDCCTSDHAVLRKSAR